MKQALKTNSCVPSRLIFCNYVQANIFRIRTYAFWNNNTWFVYVKRVWHFNSILGPDICELHFAGCRVLELWCDLHAELKGASNESFGEVPSWGGGNRWVGQDTLLLLWNLKDHYHMYKFFPQNPIPRQLNAVDFSTLNFFMIHVNGSFPSTPRSPKWYLSPRLASITNYQINYSSE
jgi:hypothetical protein